MKESVISKKVEETKIQLSKTQRLALQDALLHAGEPSSAARLLPRIIGGRKHRSAGKATTDDSLTLIGSL